MVLRAYREHMHEHYSLFYGVPVEMVEADPLYRQRMLMLCGKPVPPEMAAPMPPPGAPGPMPVGEASPIAPPSAVSGTVAAREAAMPEMPTNPLTGQQAQIATVA